MGEFSVAPDPVPTSGSSQGGGSSRAGSSTKGPPRRELKAPPPPPAPPANAPSTETYAAPGFGAGSDGFMQILSRQWPTIVGTTLAVLILGCLYLLFTPKSYLSVSKLLVEPLGKQLVGGTAGSETSADANADFLATQCDVITSEPVLAVAINKIGDVKTFRGVDQKIDFLRQTILAEVARKTQATIDIAMESKYPDEANRIVSAVVDAYQNFEAEHWRGKVKESMDLLEGGQARQRKELEDKTQRMLQLAQKNGIATDVDPEKNPARENVRSLSEALTKQHLESINAKNTYEQAKKSIANDPQMLAQVAEAQKQPAFSANPGAQLQTIQTELFKFQAQLSDAERQYMPGHPIVRKIQGRIDQLTVSYVAAAEQWWEASQNSEQSLEKSLDDAQRVAIEQAASAMEFSRLQSDVAQLKKMDDVVDARMKEIDLVRGMGATNITVLDPARISGPPQPQKGRTLAISLVLGLIAGLGLACVRDWADDRLRTPDAVSNTVGAPILGAIRIISSAFTAADRGQIVHHDPHGDAAESYRTLRTALQFGLPPRTKTLLITSPAPGDGKSTFVSNLAIAMAQAGKHILIVDADFRAPMQHRLFGLKDRAGLATVLDGADRIEDVIQRTEIEGLDILPCGPIPSAPSEMLNDQSFAEHLNDLADLYDLVLIDSPPVTAVTDAHIIAASVDATMVVIRPSSSNRKQAIETREGLRSVGARVIGVAINGVARGGSFGGPTGYYSRTAGGGRRNGSPNQSSGPTSRMDKSGNGRP